VRDMVKDMGISGKARGSESLYEKIYTNYG
jgi:hypothetical protein